MSFGKLINWYRVRFAANPVSTPALLAILAAAIFIVLAWLGIERGAMLICARLVGVVLLIECIRLARTRRRPLPSGTLPLIVFTRRTTIIAVVIAVMSLLSAMILIGYLLPE